MGFIRLVTTCSILFALLKKKKKLGSSKGLLTQNIFNQRKVLQKKGGITNTSLEMIL